MFAHSNNIPVPAKKSARLKREAQNGLGIQGLNDKDRIQSKNIERPCDLTFCIRCIRKTLWSRCTRKQVHTCCMPYCKSLLPTLDLNSTKNFWLYSAPLVKRM